MINILISLSSIELNSINSSYGEKNLIIDNFEKKEISYAARQFSFLSSMLRQNGTNLLPYEIFSLLMLQKSKKNKLQEIITIDKKEILYNNSKNEFSVSNALRKATLIKANTKNLILEWIRDKLCKTPEFYLSELLLYIENILGSLTTKTVNSIYNCILQQEVSILNVLIFLNKKVRCHYFLILFSISSFYNPNILYNTELNKNNV